MLVFVGIAKNTNSTCAIITSFSLHMYDDVGCFGMWLCSVAMFPTWWYWW